MESRSLALDFLPIIPPLALEIVDPAAIGAAAAASNDNHESSSASAQTPRTLRRCVHVHFDEETITPVANGPHVPLKSRKRPQNYDTSDLLSLASVAVGDATAEVDAGIGSSSEPESSTPTALIPPVSGGDDDGDDLPWQLPVATFVRSRGLPVDDIVPLDGEDPNEAMQRRDAHRSSLIGNILSNALVRCSQLQLVKRQRIDSVSDGDSPSFTSVSGAP